MRAPPLWTLAVRRSLSDAFSWAIAATAVALFAFGLLVLFGLLERITYVTWPTYLQQAGGVLTAAGLATLGWVVTASNQRRLSRKQHTFNLIIQMRHSTLFQERMNDLTARRAPGVGITADDVELLLQSEADLTEADRKFVRASRYLLNYFEFIASSVRIGDLDAELVRRTIRPHMVALEQKFRQYIAAEQELDKRTFVELGRLARRWP
jgi:hypothetical protein